MKNRFEKILDFLVELISKKFNVNILHLITYPLSKLYSNKVNENLLVFGSTNGNAFSGNSKELFLFLTKNSKYYCAWITSSEKILHDLQQQKYNVIFSKNIFKTIKTLKTAKYIFITHGFGDILMIKFSPQTVFIHLAHGVSFKMGGEDLEESAFAIVQKWIRKKMVNSLSYFIDSSEETKKFKMSAYGMPSKKVLITGYPRNDILNNYSQTLQVTIKRRLDLPENHETILYAPTFREYKYEDPLNEAFLKTLDKVLNKEKKILLYKPHPFMKKINLSQYKSIIGIDPQVDIMDLLIISDLLITDYSSVFYDYLLTMRPIIFFAYDLEEYKEKRDFYYDYETFVPGPIVRNSEELIEKLRTTQQWSKFFEDRRKEIRDKFHKFHDGQSTKRILDFLKIQYNNRPS